MMHINQSFHRAFRFLFLAFISCITFSVNAFNISFAQSAYQQQPGDLFEVIVTYDFTDLPTFGGGFDVYYDTTVLEFVSYVRADYEALGLTPVTSATPVGELTAPGEYTGAGLGMFKFPFTGINDAGPIGSFEFLVIGTPGITADTPCGASLCLTPTITNPWFSLAGNIISDEVFSQGISQAQVSLVPLPGAFWFMFSALIVLIQRKTRASLITQ